ncbi:sugar phosphate isomerase/epimerase [Oricola sp.]|uniref:sugar phosphate isomerase/epimerase family protein n=1 Tax=Oricola sp. TaxID=1979950 RepID=UPI0025F7E171|nr:sugar phosphate isomerase/epimerase [Oricola sp.]MCI5078281.1 sugar phosphate isomerase/epimerase [Oricola sp.]
MTAFSYQLYSSRNFPPLADTLRMLGALGYAQVEGFGGLFADLEALDELKRDLGANGLAMPTGHFGLDMVRDQPDRVLAIAEALGIEAVFVPAVPAEEREKDAAGWRALGADLAAAAKPYWEAGLSFGWHNHAFEFVETETGEMPLDLILAGDPRLVLEFDVAWSVKGGQDPLVWIEKYADRIVAAHVKDIAAEGECVDEDGWADVGHGVMDWPTIMAALRKTQARWFVMEHDNPTDHARFARRSIESARTL